MAHFWPLQRPWSLVGAPTRTLISERAIPESETKSARKASTSQEDNMNITGNAKKMRRGLVVATLLGSMSLLGVEMVGTGFASANTPGQITVGLFTCSQAGCSVTVSGSGFGSGQKESVEAVDPTNNVVWGSASVTTSLPRLGTTGTIYGPGTAGSPGGTFSVQLPIGQFMTSGCFQHLDITAAAPVLIGGHENGLINSNTAVVESACLL